MQCLKCIIAQSFANFEIILISNGTQELDLEVAQAILKQDERVKLFHSRPFDLVTALNLGLAKARGTFIARTDADDLQDVDRLAKQLRYLKDNRLDAVACAVLNENENESAAGLTTYIQWNNGLVNVKKIFYSRFIESPIIHPTMIFKRSLFEEFGGYKRGPFPEDYELWLRWFENGVQIGKHPEVLYFWNDHPKRLTRTDTRYNDEAFLLVKSEYLSRLLAKQPKRDIYIWGNKYAKRLKAFLKSRDIEIKGLIDVRSRGEAVLFTELDFAETFVLTAVRNWGAREKIASYLKEKGRLEGLDFLHTG